MALRSPYTRIAVALAAGSLAALATAGPALADGEGKAGDGNGRPSNSTTNSTVNSTVSGRGDGRQDNNPRLYKGRITARGGLALRGAPNRGSQLIRVARQGEIVSIYCKTPGQNVDGNPLWYLLTDGTWAWGAARYIDNIGPAPRWC